jgi:hypothetical protein
MEIYGCGERVRVSIPRASDPEHRYHVKPGRIVAIRRSGLTAVTDAPRDAWLYRVAFDEAAAGEMLFRHTDLTTPST